MDPGGTQIIFWQDVWPVFWNPYLYLRMFLPQKKKKKKGAFTWKKCWFLFIYLFIYLFFFFFFFFFFENGTLF